MSENVGADLFRSADSKQRDVDVALEARLRMLVADIQLGMKCRVRIGRSRRKGMFVQIECERVDVITKKVGTGRGGKAYPSEFATDSEILQMIFGLYLSYWTHEARENFEWRGRRIYGPHMDALALWEVAKRVDVRSAKHADDNDDADVEDVHPGLARILTKKRTSGEWCVLSGITVRDPDGWDRTNFKASWAEPITWAEFMRRAGSSTLYAVPVNFPMEEPTDG